MPALDIYHDTVKNALIRLLKRYYPNHTLYLAVSEDTRKTVFEEEAGQTLIEDGIIRLVTFNPTTEVIVQWIH